MHPEELKYYMTMALRGSPEALQVLKAAHGMIQTPRQKYPDASVFDKTAVNAEQVVEGAALSEKIIEKIRPLMMVADDLPEAMIVYNQATQPSREKPEEAVPESKLKKVSKYIGRRTNAE